MTDAEYDEFVKTLPPVPVIKITAAVFVPGPGSYFVSEADLALMVKNPDGSFNETY